MPGLPAQIEACLFDLDGVLTQTSKVHATAWKTLREHGAHIVARDPFELLEQR